MCPSRGTDANHPSLPLSYHLQAIALRSLIAFLRKLPLATGLRLGAAVGELLYLLDSRDRRIALINLRIAFPEKAAVEHRRILRASCRNLGRMAVEFCHLPDLHSDDVHQHLSFADEAYWRARLDAARNTGAIILTAHFGNWELFAYAHGLLGHPVTLIHRPMRNPLIDTIIDPIRGRAGTRSLAKKAAAREAIRVLRRHELLVVPSDQNQTHAYGVFVNLFGKLACTTAGAARLAAITGAPIVPAFLVREGESARHRVELLPDIELVHSDDAEADEVTNTQRCSDAIAEMIRRYPEQWIWFHRRWKTRPAGELSIY